MPKEPKQFWIAFLINLVLPGAGHIYAGKEQAGAALIIINVLSWALVGTPFGILGVIVSWLTALLTTNYAVKSFNEEVSASQKMIEEQKHKEQERLRNVVSSQSVAETFMKAYKLYSSEILTEQEFTAKKATIIGELRFKNIDGDPDDILLALAPLKQAGAVSQDEVVALKKVLLR